MKKEDVKQVLGKEFQYFTMIENPIESRGKRLHIKTIFQTSVIVNFKLRYMKSPKMELRVEYDFDRDFLSEKLVVEASKISKKLAEMMIKDEKASLKNEVGTLSVRYGDLIISSEDYENPLTKEDVLGKRGMFEEWIEKSLQSDKTRSRITAIGKAGRLLKEMMVDEWGCMDLIKEQDGLYELTFKRMLFEYVNDMELANAYFYQKLKENGFVVI